MSDLIRPPDLLLSRDLPLWHDARRFLEVRNADERTLVACGVARMQLAEMPEVEAAVVLPTILLHDVGRKRVPQELLLEAIGRNPTRPDLVRDHQLYGDEIAPDILERHRPDGMDVARVLAIIDGHDTTRYAKSPEDTVVKEADKNWRIAPHGKKTMRGWYGWSAAQYLGMVTTLSNPRLLTAPGRAMAEGFTASLRAEDALSHYLEP